MKYSGQIGSETSDRIYAIPNFRASPYHNLNIAGTIDFFTRRYVTPLTRIFDIKGSSVVDCGTGYGWFSVAYLLAGGKTAIAVDIDGERLSAAKMIAKIFSVDKHMEFIESPIHKIPLSADSVDIFVSIETLEHVGKANIRTSLQRAKEIASRGIIITTPNKLFPAIAHDTRLPFAHWLPKSIRKYYAMISGREKMNSDNTFLSPFDLNVLLDKFKPASSCLTFQTVKEYLSHYPFYLPYGSDEVNRFQYRPSAAKALYYRIASAVLGRYSYWVMPTLARIFVRR
jgi:2-polyprenyl-3-methyl-5-hydroxy-6-metoxy-1,4-benzoquinol methylase